MTTYAKPEWQAIREFYADHFDLIMMAKQGQFGVDPYSIASLFEMTPIEMNVWSDIRCCGMVFYPQLPVDKYFIDFGNPVARVAIECDGAQFHDPRADAVRDACLARLGWSVYRLTGRDCNRAGVEIEDDQGLVSWRKSPAEELLDQIRSRHDI